MRTTEHHAIFNSDVMDQCDISCECGWFVMEQTRQDAEDAYSDHLATLCEKR